MDFFEGQREIPGIPRSRLVGSRFVNVDREPRVPFWSLWLFIVGRRPRVPSNVNAELMDDVESAKKKLSSPRSSSNVIRALWLGHASFFVELDNGIRFVTDPVLDDRCGPFGLMGPQRFLPPALNADELKTLARPDFVLISHSHYDHLSTHTVRQLADSTVWVVPKGLGDWMKETGGVSESNIVELDWGYQTCLKKKKKKMEQGKQQQDDSDASFVVISCLPCQHWSKRTLTDTNKTLWASWSVHSQRGGAVFFGGDTAYSTSFRKIGDALGPFDLSLIGIGAYEPRDVLCASHASPEEAVKMHKDLQSKKSIGMHFGTWILSQEEVLQPIEDLRKAAMSEGLKADEFVTIKIGSWVNVQVSEKNKRT